MNRKPTPPRGYISLRRFAQSLFRANAEVEPDYSSWDTRKGVYVQVYLRNLDEETIWVLGDWLLAHRHERSTPRFGGGTKPVPGRIDFRVPVAMWKSLQYQSGIRFVSWVYDEGAPLVVWYPDGVDAEEEESDDYDVEDDDYDVEDSDYDIEDSDYEVETELANISIDF